MEFIKRSLNYLQPYLPLALGAFVSMLLVTGANLVVPQMLRLLIDNGITAKNWNGILLATTGLLGIAMIRGVFSFLNSYWSEKASQGIAFDLRNQVYRKLQTLRCITKISPSFDSSHWAFQPYFFWQIWAR